MSATIEALRASLAAGRAADQLRDLLSSAPRDNDDLLLLSIDDVETSIPVRAAQLLVDLLDDLSVGREVTVAPSDLPIGTTSAASLLGVSRPWIANLIDRGDLPSTRAGSKRRVALGDLIAHRRSTTQRKRHAAEELGRAIDEAGPGQPAVPTQAQPKRGFVGNIRRGRVPHVTQDPVVGRLAVTADDYPWAA
jgi:excisionase family DNA binding protein